MQIKLYIFSKKHNSTARPADAGTSIEIMLLDNSTIIDPVIALDLGSEDAPKFNYAYIPVYERYYFIANWTWTDHVNWTAMLHVDCLATYRPDIGAASLYVLRSAARYNGDIADSIYPMTSNIICHTDTKLTPWAQGADNPITILNGYFIIGVTSSHGNYGSITYHALTGSALAVLCAALLSSTVTADNGFSGDDASLALQKSLVDPFQYIKSCMWIPISTAQLQAIYPVHKTTLQVFDWELTVDNYQLGYLSTFIGTVSIPTTHHPQAASRGDYLNLSPYTACHICFPPWGNIAIEPSLINGPSNVDLFYTVDMITGKAILRIKTDVADINRMVTQVGVPIQLSQVTQDFLSAANSAIGGVAGTIGNVLSGNIGGAIQNAVSGVIGATKDMVPRSQSLGGNGGYADLDGYIAIYYEFTQIADEYMDHLGRPLCEIHTPAELGGYCLVQDGDVAIKGTTAEMTEIKSFLEGGFFYE